MKQPIYLFSDSQLLFWKEHEQLFIRRILPSGKGIDEVKAAYIGASNGDNPDFFEIFLYAMEQIGVSSCRLVPIQPEAGDYEFLETADIVLLAGGDVKEGWKIMKQNGVAERVYRRYEERATLIGISAGAIQLSLMGFEANRPFDTLQLVPFIIDVHDEANDWERLREIVNLKPGSQAFGIPFGAGLAYHQDGKVEMIRYESIVL